MSNEQRVFSTSFRYSGEVQNILDSVNQKTIADKIEFICLDFYENKTKRLEYIKDLDKQISEKRKQLDLLTSKIYKVRDVSSSLEELINNLKKCNT